MSDCTISFNSKGEKVYAPKVGSPKVVWTKANCEQRLTDAAKIGKLQETLKASAQWLADAPLGWETKYRTDCILLFHETFDRLGLQESANKELDKPKTKRAPFLFGKLAPKPKVASLFGGKKSER